MILFGMNNTFLCLPPLQVRLTHEVKERWDSGDIKEIGSATPPIQPHRQDGLQVLAPGKIKRGKAGTKVIIKSVVLIFIVCLHWCQLYSTLTSPYSLPSWQAISFLEVGGAQSWAIYNSSDFSESIFFHLPPSRHELAGTMQQLVKFNAKVQKYSFVCNVFLCLATFKRKNRSTFILVC